jgi:Sulfotransferase family
MRTFTEPIFPFVVGCSRSGTTLVRAMLDAHPGMAVPPESHFALAPDVRRLRRALRRERWFALWEIEAPDLRGLGVADAVRALFAAYAAKEGKPRYADKTPHYVSRLPELAARFPEARFLHVVRDGRDVALSLREVPWGPDSVEEAALHWRRRVLEGQAAGLGPDRYREVRYEALVADPEGELYGVATWLGLPYDDAMLGYPDRPLVVPYPAHHRRLRRPPTPGLRDWRREMAPDEVARFEAVAGDALEAFGY